MGLLLIGGFEMGLDVGAAVASELVGLLLIGGLETGLGVGAVVASELGPEVGSDERLGAADASATAAVLKLGAAVRADGHRVARDLRGERPVLDAPLHAEHDRGGRRCRVVARLQHHRDG